MKNTQEWLAAVREKLATEGFPEATGYRVSKTVGVSEATVRLWERGAQMDDMSAIKVADYLERDRSEVLMAAAWSRAKDATARKEWELAAKKALGVAAAILLLTGSGALLSSLGLFNNFEIIDSAWAIALAISPEYRLCALLVTLLAWGLLRQRPHAAHAWGGRGSVG